MTSVAYNENDHDIINRIKEPFNNLFHSMLRSHLCTNYIASYTLESFIIKAIKPKAIRNL